MSPPAFVSVLRRFTRRGFKEAEVKELAGWMCDVLDNINDEAVIERVKGKVLDICARFPVYA
nr:serine hydroxymethyltransferase [Salmonella sp. NCTC 7297]